MKLNRTWLTPPRSFKRRVRIEDLAPDGVCIRVNWDRFVPGASVFVPCLDTAECARQFNELARTRDWVWDARLRVEKTRWGIRFWRVL
jgi:hypothetical protein